MGEEAVPAGRSGNVSQRFSAAHGIFARSWVHAILPASETLNAAFDHSNAGLAAVPNSNTLSDDTTKVVTFHHEVDNKQIEVSEQRPTARAGLDYMAQEDTLRGSLIQSRDDFYKNWYTGINWLPESPEIASWGLRHSAVCTSLSGERQLSWVGTSMGASVNGTVTVPPAGSRTTTTSVTRVRILRSEGQPVEIRGYTDHSYLARALRACALGSALRACASAPTK